MEKALSNDDIKIALAEVIDPETRLSIMRMGLIKEISVDDRGAVKVVFRPSSPTCPMAYALAGAIKNKIELVNIFRGIHI